METEKNTAPPGPMGLGAWLIPGQRQGERVERKDIKTEKRVPCPSGGGVRKRFPEEDTLLCVEIIPQIGCKIKRDRQTISKKNGEK